MVVVKRKIFTCLRKKTAERTLGLFSEQKARWWWCSPLLLVTAWGIWPGGILVAEAVYMALGLTSWPNRVLHLCPSRLESPHGRVALHAEGRLIRWYLKVWLLSIPYYYCYL